MDIGCQPDTLLMMRLAPVAPSLTHLGEEREQQAHITWPEIGHTHTFCYRDDWHIVILRENEMLKDIFVAPELLSQATTKGE